MSSIKVSEIFYSIQGEGRFMGVPSVFLRTFGCNFKCQGFGMPKGQLSNEADTIAQSASNFKSYDDLPLVGTGCDSYASWHPAFKHLSPMMTVDEIAEKVFSMMVNQDTHLVITGGEPLLGWQRSYIDLLSHDLLFKNLRHLTFETNGTKPIDYDLDEFLWEWRHNRIVGPASITFSVSPKLSVSGHTREEAIIPDVLLQYQKIGYTYVKYVIATEEDAEEALEVTNIYRDAGFRGPVYFMPVGGVESVYNLNNRKVAELAMKHGVRYSDRLHLPLFGNVWGA